MKNLSISAFCPWTLWTWPCKRWAPGRLDASGKWHLNDMTCWHKKKDLIIIPTVWAHSGIVWCNDSLNKCIAYTFRTITSTTKLQRHCSQCACHKGTYIYCIIYILYIYYIASYIHNAYYTLHYITLHASCSKHSSAKQWTEAQNLRKLCLGTALLHQFKRILSNSSCNFSSFMLKQKKQVQKPWGPPSRRSTDCGKLTLSNSCSPNTHGLNSEASFPKISTAGAEGAGSVKLSLTA